MTNESKFDLIRSYNLPKGHYAITGSGPMGIRGLREIGDIDIIVSQTLWNDLAHKYGISEVNDIQKIISSDGKIEFFWEGSFPADPEKPTVSEMIESADFIDGFSFVSLEHILYFKRKMARPKDLEDIKLIEEWQKGLFDKSV